MRKENWDRFCYNISTRLAIEALQLFKAHIDENRNDDQPGSGREFLDIICQKIRAKFEASLSERYFVENDGHKRFPSNRDRLKHEGALSI